MDVDLKLKEAFPKPEDAGGHCMMRTGQGARTLMVISGPKSTETLKDFMGQGKVFMNSSERPKYGCSCKYNIGEICCNFCYAFFLFHHAVMLSCQKWEKIGEKQSKGKGGGVGPMLTLNF